MDARANDDTLGVAPAAPAAPAPASTYRPHLDGLRAIAVYLVVAFHAGSGLFAGGFVGVDVFFVLSGYLVTQLLLRDLGAGGAIRLGRFYARRFRRLLPAAFVALIVTAAVYTVVASPSELSGVSGSFQAAFLYSTNWYFIHHSTGYFGADITTNPVLHFWSLAVEEQFYLVWPLALGGLFAATRRFGERQRRAVRIIVAVVLLMSLARALSLRSSNPDWAYYGSDARAYQLLAGASLALIPSLAVTDRFRRALRAAAVAVIAVLLIFATSWVHFDAIGRGICVAAIASTFIAVIELVDGGLVKRALSTRPIVYLGKISYGTYLWHWIVILVLVKNFTLGTGATIATASVVATAMASLSYQMLEHPVRASRVLDRYRLPVIATGLIVSVVSALVFIPAIIDRPASAPALLGTTVGFTPVPKGINARGAFEAAQKEGGPFTNCLNQPVDVCTVVHGTGRHILLMGDSHAWMLIPTFVAIATKEHLTLSVSVLGECPWQLGLYPGKLQAQGVTTDPHRCVLQKEDAYDRVIPALHPDIIVVTNAIYDYPIQQWSDAQGHRTHVTQADQRAASLASLNAMRAPGRHIVVIEPIPEGAVNPLLCLAHSTVVERCRGINSIYPSPLETYYRKLAAHDPSIVDLDIDRLVCPFLPICDPIVNGAIVKWDTGHLTVAFAKTLADPIDENLKARKLIP